ncbi:MAG: ABC transporter transmembrane domain-containing protein [Vicinamibacterales bacterium]
MRRHFKGYWPLVALALILAAVNQMFSLLDPLDLPPRHRRIRHALLRVHHRRVLPRCEHAARARRSASPSSRASPRTSRTTTSTSSPSGSGAQIYADGIRHSLELPYSVFEDQRSGETLGKLQKVRTDVEKLLSAVDQHPLYVAHRHHLRHDLRVDRALADRADLLPDSAGARHPELGPQPERSRRSRRRSSRRRRRSRASTTESLRNIELVKSLGLASQEIARLNSTTDKILQLELKKVRYLRSLSFIQGTVVNFCGRASCS